MIFNGTDKSQSELLSVLQLIKISPYSAEEVNWIDCQSLRDEQRASLGDSIRNEL